MGATCCNCTRDSEQLDYQNSTDLNDPILIIDRREANEFIIADKQLLSSPCHNDFYVQINSPNTKLKSELLVQREVTNLNQKYGIGRLLGKGSFGQVYECWSKSNPAHKLALKIMPKFKAANSLNYANSLENELRALFKLIHPNIVRVFDIIQDQKNFYVVQELMTDGDLCSLLAKRSFTEQEVRKIVYQLCTAIKIIHDQGQIHRDIKLENIMIADAENLVVKLTDFGFTQPQTNFQYYCGTPQYMAPEMVMQRGQGPDSVPIVSYPIDIWAIGVVTYELVSGFGLTPFKKMNEDELRDAILKSEPQFNQPIFKNISPLAIDFIKKCLTKYQTKRPTIVELLGHKWLQNEKQKLNISNYVTERQNLGVNLQKREHQKLQNTVCRRVILQKLIWLNQSAQQVNKMADLYNHIDTNKDGVLQIDEIVKGLREHLGDADWSSERWKNVFNLMDSDQNGTVNFQEFITVFANMDELVTKENIKDLFSIFDLNGDGVITPEELKAIFQGEMLQQVENEDFWVKIISEMDIDKDGLISYQEFYDAMVSVIHSQTQQIKI